MTLEFFRVLIPKLGRLGVQRTRTVGYGQLSAPEKTVRMCLLIWLPKQALQTEQHALHVVHGAPLVLQDVETDTAREVNVGVVDGSLEEDCRRRVGIVVGEGKGQLEREALVGCVARSADGSGPVQKVAVCVGEGGDAG